MNDVGSRACPVCGCPKERLLTVKEVASALRCSRAYVYYLVRHRKLKALRSDRIVRIDHESFDRYWTNNMAETA